MGICRKTTGEIMDINSWETGKVNELRYWQKWFPRKGVLHQTSKRLTSRFDFMIGDKKEVVIADLGAGAISVIGDHRKDVKVTVIASDLLALEFEKTRKKQGVTLITPIERQDMAALTYPGNYFDIVHCSNALDHCQEPKKALKEMVRICKPQGWIYIRHFAHEGRRQAYSGMHQWNLDPTEEGDCIIWDRRLNSSKTFLLSDIYPGFKNIIKLFRKFTLLTSFVQKK